MLSVFFSLNFSLTGRPCIRIRSFSAAMSIRSRRHWYYFWAWGINNKYISVIKRPHAVNKCWLLDHWSPEARRPNVAGLCIRIRSLSAISIHSRRHWYYLWTWGINNKYISVMKRPHDVNKWWVLDHWRFPHKWFSLTGRPCIRIHSFSAVSIHSIRHWYYLWAWGINIKWSSRDCTLSIRINGDCWTDHWSSEARRPMMPGAVFSSAGFYFARAHFYSWAGACLFLFYRKYLVGKYCTINEENNLWWMLAFHIYYVLVKNI